MTVMLVLQLLVAVIVVQTAMVADPLLAGAVGVFWWSTLPALDSAIWVYRRDWDRGRAWICCGLLIGSGFFRAAAVAFAFVVYMAVSGRPLGPEVEYTLIRMFAGLFLAVGVSLAACIASLVCGRHVWINPRLRELLHDDMSVPARPQNAVYANYALALVILVTAAPFLAAMGVALTVVQIPAVTFVIVLVGASLAVVSSCCFANRIIAGSPSECWYAISVDPVNGEH